MIKKKWANIFNRELHMKPGVSELEANGPGLVFVKENGVRKKLYLPELEDEDTYQETIFELIEEFDLNGGPNFLAEGGITLETGEKARVHIVLPPAADWAQLTVARKTDALKSLDDLRKTGSFNSKIQRFLEASVKSKATIILSGGSGVGKTTMLEALTREFGDMERIGIVEDVSELQLEQENVTYLSSTVWRPGTDINDVASLSWCVQQLNRQRCDRIIIGETRGGEFADFIVAANSGCEGSITTIHANDPRAALRKMSNFVVMGIDQPLRSANENIAKTLDLIVQLGFDKNGKHKITAITEVTELVGSDEDAKVTTHKIFEYDPKSDGYKYAHPTDNFRRLLEKGGYDPITFNRTVNGGLPSLEENPLARFQKGVK